MVRLKESLQLTQPFLLKLPLPAEVVNALRNGDLGDASVRSSDAKETGNKFGELGMDKDLMRDSTPLTNKRSRQRHTGYPRTSRNS